MSALVPILTAIPVFLMYSFMDVKQARFYLQYFQDLTREWNKTEGPLSDKNKKNMIDEDGTYIKQLLRNDKEYLNRVEKEFESIIANQMLTTED
ncbi:hypothetical protein ABK040_001307 [Willaertia magna]